MNNPIIEEVRAARAALAEEHGYDRQKIYEWARAAHAERQRELESTSPNKASLPTRDPRESLSESKAVS